MTGDGGMRFEEGGESDVSGTDEARFRIVLFDGPTGFGLPDWAVFLPTTDVLTIFEALEENDLVPAGFSTASVDVLDADFVEVFDLATRLAGASKQFAIALIHDSLEGRRRTWLTGTDLNVAADDDATELRRREIMLGRSRRTDAEATDALEWLQNRL